MPTRKCNYCNTEKCPKNGELEILKKDVDNLRKGNNANKKFYRKYFKYLLIACAILTFELILSMAYDGKEGVILGIEKIMSIVSRNK